jgi:hypothetical protein
MARGWESKSVESQIESAHPIHSSKHAVPLTPDQMRIARERESLELSRKRVCHDLATATNPRYRAQLEATVRYLDGRIAELTTSISH